MGCSEQQHCPLQVEVQLLGVLVLAGELWQWGGINKCSESWKTGGVVKVKSISSTTRGGFRPAG